MPEKDDLMKDAANNVTKQHLKHVTAPQDCVDYFSFKIDFSKAQFWDGTRAAQFRKETNMAPKGKSTGKWIVTLHDIHDQNVYKDNGLFLWTKDSSGGWNEMESRLTLGDMKMLGECVPKESNSKNNKSIKEALEWRQAALIKKGYNTQIPNCLTFTEFVNYLAQKKLLPERPDPNFMAAESDETQQQDERPFDQQQHSAHDTLEHVVHHHVVQNDEMLMDTPAHTEGLHSPSLLEQQASFSQMVESEIVVDSQAMYNPEDLIFPDEEMRQLRAENERLHTENQALTNDKRKILESHVVLEEKLSEGNTVNTENMISALTGVIDDRMQKFNDSVETCIKREVRNTFNGSSQLDQLMDQTKNTANAVNNYSIRMDKLTIKVDEMDKSVQTVVRTQDQNQGSLDTILKISRSVKTQSGSQKGEGGTDASLNDSGIASPSLASKSSNTKPKMVRTCSFCLENTHGYDTCPQRPMNYKCFRCNGISHRDENCYSVKKTCDVCKSVGHHVSLHYLTDPTERCQVMKTFSVDLFSHYASGTQLPPRPTAGNASQMRSRPMPPKRGSTASSSNTPQVWLTTPPNYKRSKFE